MNPDAPVPQSENSPVKRNEPAPVHASFDLPSAKAQVDQLAPSNDSVLPFSQVPHRNRRLPTRCNALSGQWTDSTLHPARIWVALSWRNALSVG